MPVILVVDDDVQIREWMKGVLERDGYSVLEAGNGNQACAWYDRLQPDLVVMDMYMPDKEGLETILKMRRHRVPAKILAISGNFYESYDVGAIAKTFGAETALQKPFSAKELLEQVKLLLETGDRSGN